MNLIDPDNIITSQNQAYLHNKQCLLNKYPDLLGIQIDMLAQYIRCDIKYALNPNYSSDLMLKILNLIFNYQCGNFNGNFIKKFIHNILIEFNINIYRKQMEQEINLIIIEN